MVSGCRPEYWLTKIRVAPSCCPLFPHVGGFATSRKVLEDPYTFWGIWYTTNSQEGKWKITENETRFDENNDAQDNPPGLRIQQAIVTNIWTYLMCLCNWQGRGQNPIAEQTRQSTTDNNPKLYAQNSQARNQCGEVLPRSFWKTKSPKKPLKYFKLRLW